MTAGHKQASVSTTSDYQLSSAHNLIGKWQCAITNMNYDIMVLKGSGVQMPLRVLALK